MTLFSPTSGLDQPQGEIDNVKRMVYSKAESYELSTVKSHVDSLEHTLRELRTEIAGIWNQLQEMEPPR